jgi:hypothetical protein
MLQFTAPKTGVLLDGVVRLALEDDTPNGVKAWDVLGRFDLPAIWHSIAEPTVVAKTGEGAGNYVLQIATYVPVGMGNDVDHVATALDGALMRSQLLILDGEDMAGGPVTTIDLPSHVNYGLHSVLLEWDQMKEK